VNLAEEKAMAHRFDEKHRFSDGKVPFAAGSRGKGEGLTGLSMKEALLVV
jgi:hypothetical protein